MVRREAVVSRTRDGLPNDETVEASAWRVRDVRGHFFILATRFLRASTSLR